MQMSLIFLGEGGAGKCLICPTQEGRMLHFVVFDLVRVLIIDWYGRKVEARANKSETQKRLKLFCNDFSLHVYHRFLWEITDEKENIGGGGPLVVFKVRCLYCDRYELFCTAKDWR